MPGSRRAAGIALPHCCLALPVSPLSVPIPEWGLPTRALQSVTGMCTRVWVSVASAQSCIQACAARLCVLGECLPGDNPRLDLPA